MFIYIVVLKLPDLQKWLYLVLFNLLWKMIFSAGVIPVPIKHTLSLIPFESTWSEEVPKSNCNDLSSIPI